MLSHEHNELLTRFGPETPMGEFLREYWAPAVRSAALEPGGAPVRVRMLGENFVAFRTDDGRVGFFDEACPHRGASMALARNEDNALRCIFHGWKIDVTGKVLETPCEAPARREAFARSLRVRHYPTREAGALVWVYLGKRPEPPAFPWFGFMDLPAAQVHVRRALVPYNWLQGLEAHLDAAHLGILHSGFLSAPRPTKDVRDLQLAVEDAAPKIEMDKMPYGIREGALRETEGGSIYARIRQIVLPYFIFIPQGPDSPLSWRATVPVDDEWNAEWYMLYDPVKPVSEHAIEFQFRDASPNPDNFAEDLGSVDTMWHQNRKAMKTGHFSGLTRNIPFEDFIVQSSMGRRVDRRREQLGPSDAITVHVRRMLIEAVQDFQKGQATPPWQSGEIDFGAIRAAAVTIDKNAQWRDAVPTRDELRRQTMEHH